MPNKLREENVKHLGTFKIEQLGRLGINSQWVNMWSEGCLEDKKVFFEVLPTTMSPRRYFETFDPTFKHPIAFFFVQGEACASFTYDNTKETS